ncbi:MAG: hypothetical protein IT362_03895 [Deltaproteobacteria bacterium]|nr:hypothetical protein [Deltaproteobacteria bacterium]
MAKGGRKGALEQFAGCVLLSLGLLNILLALKSGSPPDIFSYALSAIGATSLLTGLWRARN